MNTTINEKGTLIILAETPLERYALQKWAAENMNVEVDDETIEVSGTMNTKNFIIDCSDDPTHVPGRS